MNSVSNYVTSIHLFIILTIILIAFLFTCQILYVMVIEQILIFLCVAYDDTINWTFVIFSIIITLHKTIQFIQEYHNSTFCIKGVFYILFLLLSAVR